MTKYEVGIIRTLVEVRTIEAIDEEMAVNSVRNFGGYPKISNEATKVYYVKKIEEKENKHVGKAH